jgi:serine/threonine protein kinase
LFTFIFYLAYHVSDDWLQGCYVCIVTGYCEGGDMWVFLFGCAILVATVDFLFTLFCLAVSFLVGLNWWRKQMGHTSQRRLLVITDFLYSLFPFVSCFGLTILKCVLTVLNNHQKLLRWFAQLALAVDYLHSNYVLHRDLKVSEK